MEERTRELKQAKLKAEQEARADSLTGILNRRSFVQDATALLKLAARKQQACSLLIFDLDYFKNINDQGGHLAGDRVLKEMAGRVRKRLRQNDQLFRIGGEEFMVVLAPASRQPPMQPEPWQRSPAPLQPVSSGPAASGTPDTP